MTASTSTEFTPQPSGENRPPPPPPPPPSQFDWRALLPRTTQEIAVCACAAALIILFFAPWIKSYEYASGLSLARYGSDKFWLWSIPILSLATLAFHRHKTALKWLGTITPIAVWLCIVSLLSNTGYQGVQALHWGASLTLLVSLGLLGVSGERRFTAPVDLAVRKLSSRRADIYSHWGGVSPGVHFSAAEFCNSLESAVRAKEWPGVELLRVPYSEAGALSHKREYLRIIRQRHLFDICASTFGKDYFFTLREGEIPAVVDLRAALVVFLGILVVLGISIQILGTYGGLCATLFVLLFIAWALFNILKMGMTKFDSALMQLPALGPVYEAYFRPDTYFQQDTRMVFLQSVSDLVKKEIEETVSAKGLKFIDCFEKQPVLEGIYRRSRVKTSEE